MRVRRTVTLTGFDPAPVLAFFPALRSEWDALRFVDGDLRHPDDGSIVDGLQLVRGVHGQPGAHYLVHPEADDHTDATPVEFDVDRTARDGIEVSAESSELDASGQAVLRFRPAPEVVGSFDIDLAALSPEAEAKGCMAWLLGGRATANGAVDANAFEDGGRLIALEGRANRFPFRINVDIAARGAHLGADVEIVLRAKGIARPVLWFGGRAIRRSITKGIGDLASELGAARTKLEILSMVVEHNGGHEATVHEMAWRPDWEPSVPSTLDRDDPAVQEVLAWLVPGDPPAGV